MRRLIAWLRWLADSLWETPGFDYAARLMDGQRTCESIWKEAELDNGPALG